MLWRHYVRCNSTNTSSLSDSWSPVLCKWISFVILFLIITPRRLHSAMENVKSDYSCFFPGFSQWGRKEMFYLTTHSTHFIYGYMVSDTQTMREKTCCRHYMGDFLSISSKGSFICTILRQDSTHHGLYYISCGALAGTSITVSVTLYDGLLPIPVGLLVLTCTRQCSPPPPPYSLPLNVHVKHSDLTWPHLYDGPSACYRFRSDCSYSLVPASEGVLSCLWDGAYKTTLAVNR